MEEAGAAEVGWETEGGHGETWAAGGETAWLESAGVAEAAGGDDPFHRDWAYW
jgi:hypothetical protein